MKMIKLNDDYFVMSTEIVFIEVCETGIRIITKTGERCYVAPDYQRSKYETCDRILKEIEDANHDQR